ncbi:LysR family transcriptional regulator [Burkholderia gladioli]|uniref:LysR family transcriptional regulator n=1 Tax=Burkholderia gladioli TaxID=28095 RepID=UPI0031330087
MTNSLSSLRGADLALLGSLDVLLAEANVTRAAARLHLSQPALSAQLARLRELTGDPLLVPARNGRGMTPTARALAIREPLRAALQSLQAALAHGAGFDPAQDARTFQILASDNGFVMAGVDLVRRVAPRSCAWRSARCRSTASPTGSSAARPTC